MSLDDLETAKADATLYLDELKTRTEVDALVELRDNVIPLLQAFMNVSIEEHIEHAGAIMELIETVEDVIHPELAAIIVGTIEAGKLICQILIDNKVELENDLAQRQLQKAIKFYKQNAVITAERVAEVTTEIDDYEEEDDDSTPSESPEEASPLILPNGNTETTDESPDVDEFAEEDDSVDEALAESGD